MRARVAIPAAVLALASTVSAQTPGFWLPGLAPGTMQGSTTTLSQDGTAAAGGNFSTTTNPIIAPGFTWTRAGGRQDFGLLPGMPARSAAFAMSSDGQTIVGRMQDSTVRAYRWMGSGPLQDLGLLPGQERSYAAGISGDGQTVVGTCENSPMGNAYGEAFRWTAGQGMQGLGYLRSNGSLSVAKAISRDASTIVGTSQSGGPFGGPIEAFVWTQAGGMRALPNLPGSTSLEGFAYGVNTDGSVAVGSGSSATPEHYTHAVRWANGAAHDLGTVAPSVGSVAYALSDDGNVVGGASGLVASVWTPATGMMDLSAYLSAHGVSVPPGYSLMQVSAISGDGLTFAGQAHNLTTSTYEGFIATIPSPCSVLVLALPALMRRRRSAA